MSRDRTDELVEAALPLVPELGKRLYGALARRGQMHGLTAGQVKVILQLGTRGRLSVGEIAEGLGVSLPAASEVVDRLVERGFAERHSDATDRRRVLVAPSPTAVEIVSDLCELRRDQLRRALLALPPAERPVLVRSLRALIASLDDVTDREAGEDREPAPARSHS